MHTCNVMASGKKHFINIVILFFLTTGMVFGLYVYTESNTLYAVTDTIQVSLEVTSGIAITSPNDVTMSPALTTAVNKSVGSAAWTVTTNNQGGYTLAVKASASPALVDSGTSESFADYTEASAGTPDVWSVSSAYEFGFSAVGTDVEAEYTDASSDGTPESSCPTDGTLGSTDHGFEGFTTSDELIASSNAETSTSGTASTLCLAAEQNGVFAPSGTYEATVTATAVVQ